MTSPGGSGRTTRFIAACLGAIFVAAAVVIVVRSAADLGVGEIVAALVLGVLGVDAIAGAIRDRRSLLSRIGPLP